MTVQIACIGGAVLDLVYGVDRLPGEDGKTRALSYFETGGGMAANAAVTIARLGGSAAWWGRLGGDDKGARVLEGLKQDQVNIDTVRIVDDAISSHSLVLSDRAGNRAIVLYRSDALDPDPAWLPLHAVATLNAVLADNRWIEGAVATLSAARQAGIPAVLDADAGADPRTVEAVRCASHAVFSEPGLAEIYNTNDPAEGLRRAAADAPFVAVTLGSRGVRWLKRGGEIQSLPAFPVRAIETVGAGDVFHGAFAFALANSMSEEEGLRFSAAAAALKCASEGGRISFPDRVAVDRLLRDLQKGNLY
ncbi:sugar kinase [Aquamicrobium sp. LC103]|nr:sugar kinase [Aquamicrobium sp. LC103]